MSSTNLVRLQDMARIAAPGALDGMIRMETFNVLKEFFQRTDAWLFEMPVYIVPQINDYQLEPCAGRGNQQVDGAGAVGQSECNFQLCADVSAAVLHRQ